MPHSADRSDLRARIAERAYFAWQSGAAGRDIDHWLAAEAVERDMIPDLAGRIADPKPRSLLSRLAHFTGRS